MKAERLLSGALLIFSSFAAQNWAGASEADRIRAMAEGGPQAQAEAFTNSGGASSGVGMTRAAAPQPDKDSLWLQLKDIQRSLSDYKAEAEIGLPRFERHRDPHAYGIGDFGAGFLWAMAPASAIMDVDTADNFSPYGRFLPRVLGWAVTILSLPPAIAVGGVSVIFGFAHFPIFR